MSFGYNSSKYFSSISASPSPTPSNSRYFSSTPIQQKPKVDYSPAAQRKVEKRVEGKERQLKQYGVEVEKPEATRSILSRILAPLNASGNTVQGALFNATDGDSSTGVGEGAWKGAKSLNPLADSKDISEKSFSDVLDNLGWKTSADDNIIGNKGAHFIAGLTGDVLLDPMTYMTLGLKPLLTGGSKLLKVGEKAILEATAKKSLEKAGKEITEEAVQSLVNRASKLMGNQPNKVDTAFHIPGVKKFTGIKDETLRKIGDKTGLAKVGQAIGKVKDGILDYEITRGKNGSLGKAFVPDYELKKLAQKSPDDAMQVLNYFDLVRDHTGAYNKANRELEDKAIEYFGGTSTDAQSLISHLIETKSTKKIDKIIGQEVVPNVPYQPALDVEKARLRRVKAELEGKLAQAKAGAPNTSPLSTGVEAKPDWLNLSHDEINGSDFFGLDKQTDIPYPFQKLFGEKKDAENLYKVEIKDLDPKTGKLVDEQQQAVIDYKRLSAATGDAPHSLSDLDSLPHSDVVQANEEMVRRLREGSGVKSSALPQSIEGVNQRIKELTNEINLMKRQYSVPGTEMDRALKFDPNDDTIKLMEEELIGLREKQFKLQPKPQASVDPKLQAIRKRGEDTAALLAKYKREGVDQSIIDSTELELSALRKQYGDYVRGTSSPVAKVANEIPTSPITKALEPDAKTGMYPFKKLFGEGFNSEEVERASKLRGAIGRKLEAYPDHPEYLALRGEAEAIMATQGDGIIEAAEMELKAAKSFFKKHYDYPENQFMLKTIERAEIVIEKAKQILGKTTPTKIDTPFIPKKTDWLKQEKSPVQKVAPDVESIISPSDSLDDIFIPKGTPEFQDAYKKAYNTDARPKSIKDLESEISSVEQSLADMDTHMSKVFPNLKKTTFRDIVDKIDEPINIFERTDPITGAEHEVTDEAIKKAVLSVKDDFKQWGLDEIKVGKLDAEQVLDDYLYHMLNLDLKKAKGKSPFSYEARDNYDFAVTNQNAIERRFKKETIYQINKKIEEKHGIKDFFETVISRIYYERGLKHNKLMFDAGFQNDLIQNVGKEVSSLKEVPTGWVVIYPQGRFVKKEVNTIEGETISQGAQLGEILKHTKQLENNYIMIDPDKISKDVMREYGPSVAIPKQIYEHMAQSAKADFDDKTNFFLKIYDHFTNLWKINQTAVVPGFSGRNLVSNTFQSFLNVGEEALNPRTHLQATKILRKSDEVVYNGMTGRQLYDLMETKGVIGSNFIDKDIDRFSRTKINAELGTPLDKLKKFNPFSLEFKPYQMGRKLSSAVENQGRVVNFMSNLKLGKSVDEAVDNTNKFLFDYGDLTDFEKTYMRRIIPYYTWMRKNLPLQIEQMIEKPDVYRTIQKARNNLNNLSEAPNEQYLGDYAKDWMRLPMTAPVDGKEQPLYFNPSLPYMDLGKLPNPSDLGGFARARASELNPMLKLAIELFPKKGNDLFFNSPLIENPGDMDTAPAYIGKTPLKYITPTAKEATDGTVKMSPKLRHFLQSITSLEHIDKIASTEGTQQTFNILSALTGLKVAPYDEERSAFWDKKRQYEALLEKEREAVNVGAMPSAEQRSKGLGKYSSKYFK